MSNQGKTDRQRRELMRLRAAIARQQAQMEQYEHHGIPVWVRSTLRGRHAEFCLCYECQQFKPGQADNCPIAQAVYMHCIEHGLVLVVWECPQFVKKVDDGEAQEAATAGSGS